MRQAIIWTSTDSISWRIYAALGVEGGGCWGVECVCVCVCVWGGGGGGGLGGQGSHRNDGQY